MNLDRLLWLRTKRALHNCYRFWKRSEPGPKSGSSTSERSSIIKSASQSWSLPWERTFNNETELDIRRHRDRYCRGRWNSAIQPATAGRGRRRAQSRRNERHRTVSNGTTVADPSEACISRRSPAGSADLFNGASHSCGGESYG